MVLNVDWGQIENMSDIAATFGDDNLYDYTPEDGGIYDIALAPDLTDYEREDAERWARFSKGVILITGKVGSGKTTLLHILTWKFKRYFRKVAILDSKPRPIFGAYAPHSEEFLLNQLERIAEMMDTSNDMLARQINAHVWLSTKGQVFLKNSVYALDEAKRYLPRGTPNLAICQLFLSLTTVWRHMDACLIGVCTKKDDITDHCFPEVTAEIKCRQSTDREDEHIASLLPLSFNGASGVFSYPEKPILLRTRALEEIPEWKHPPLAGMRWVDLFNSKNAQGVHIPKVFKKDVRRKQLEREAQNGGL